jgi:hypothetical protein
MGSQVGEANVATPTALLLKPDRSDAASQSVVMRRYRT